MESVKTIRSVERAFAVLRALQDLHEGATLIDLQHATGLSGPTVMRLLKTLIAAKAVRRSATDQRYRNIIQLNAGHGGGEPTERFADLAAAWLDELCTRVEWPSDLAIHRNDDDYLSVLESTLRQSRFYVRRPKGRVRVNLLGSAAGTAFVAALTQTRRRELVEAARRNRDPHNRKVIAAGDLERRVEEVRRRGYAMRHPVYRGGSFNGPARDDKLQAIAVPLVAGSRVLGALNINWNRDAMTEREMVRRHLTALTEAARGIARAAQDQGLERILPGVEDADADFGNAGE